MTSLTFLQKDTQAAAATRIYNVEKKKKTKKYPAPELAGTEWGKNQKLRAASTICSAFAFGR
jgi:hypothetical protein